MKKSFVGSVLFRLPLIVSLGVLLPMLAAIWHSGSRATRIIRQDAEDNMALRAEALAESVSNWDEMSALALKNLSRQPDIVSMDASRQRPVLIEMAQTYEHLYLATTTDLEGLNVARNDDKEPKFYGDRPWFLGAQAGSDITRQTLISRTTQEPALCISTPIRQASQGISGVAATCTDLTVLAQQVGAIRLGETGYAFLVDDTGRVLAHPLPEFSSTLKDLSDYPAVESVLQGDGQSLSFTDDSGIQWISHGITLSNGWGIIVQMQESEVLQQVYAYRHFSLTLAVLVTLSVGTLSWLIVRRMLYPINHLTSAATALSEGDLTQQVKSQSKDELGTLAKAFNSMAQQLQLSFSDLKQTNGELEQALVELRQTQAKMLHSEKMSALGQMVAGIAHEINNPVNFIYGNLNHLKTYTHELLSVLQLYEVHYPNPVPEIQEQSEIIDIGFVKEDLDKLTKSMNVGVERIREIVLSLRNFSRMDEADRKTVDIHEGLESTLMILSHRLKAQPERPAIAIVRDFDNLPQIECFPGQLNQVFMNILANAIDALEAEASEAKSYEDASAQKAPQITLRTETRVDSIVISISDNGSGIPTEVKNRIFDPFFTTKSVGKGTGMGLAISYQIITEKHNGKLKCFSDQGVGTEFVIELPLTYQQEDSSEPDRESLSA